MLGEKSSIRVKAVKHYLLHRASRIDGDCLVGYAGLESRVAAWLKEHGYKVCFTGQRPRILPAVALENTPKSSKNRQKVLDYLRKLDRALLRCDPHSNDAVKFIADVARAWPNEEIMVWATRMDEVRNIGRGLRRYGLDPTMLDSRHFPAKAGRIVISTFSALGEGLVRLNTRGIAVVLNPAELIRNKFCRDILQHPCRARMWGFLPRTAKLAPYDRSRVAVVFGDDEIDLLAPTVMRQPESVLFLQIFGGRKLSSDLNIVDLKRNGIWHNELRNRRIAKLARALAEKDEAVLHGDYPLVAEYSGLLTAKRLGILVENIEHALALAKLLPHWPVMASWPVYAAGLSENDCRILESGWCDPKQKTQFIATAVGLSYAGKADILIRADGGVGLPSGWREDSIRKYGKCPRWIIDFDDRFHPELRIRSRQRRAAYIAAGWEVSKNSFSPCQPA